ncbi:1,2-phenylacetyl-CoA epoxidase subunit PaaD [Marinoscillum sp.]|uniref:1,2-phenylacetyl-CoA epoxidase subunit PaaD n=1 Tax=Marinoscillum sp. TaxID=2024838 RepID=UPI003BAD689C
MVTPTLHIDNDQVEKALWDVTDPEIPVLSIMDMGVVRSVTLDGKEVQIAITPTYSGCPAMDTIADDIKRALKGLGFTARVKLVLSPAWTTDWITDRGRKKLEEYGIAPPMSEAADKAALLDGERIVKCTHCGSTNTRMISQFGSTACKALFQCNECDEPFDYFKCLK